MTMIHAPTWRKITPGTCERHYRRKPESGVGERAAVARVLLDTGPLVALFKRNDKAHRRAVGWFSRNRADLVTTHAVLTEAWHLINPTARKNLMAFAGEALLVPELPGDAVRRLARLLDAHADTPMAYADATLVLLAHELGELRVATIDVEDFGVYRTEGKKRLRVEFRRDRRRARLSERPTAGACRAAPRARRAPRAACRSCARRRGRRRRAPPRRRS